MGILWENYQTKMRSIKVSTFQRCLDKRKNSFNKRKKKFLTMKYLYWKLLYKQGSRGSPGKIGIYWLFFFFSAPIWNTEKRKKDQQIYLFPHFSFSVQHMLLKLILIYDVSHRIQLFLLHIILNVIIIDHFVILFM